MIEKIEQFAPLRGGRVAECGPNSALLAVFGDAVYDAHERKGNSHDP